MSVFFNYAARSDVGYVRAGKENQDGAYAGPNLLVLADGMGGAAGGEIASSVAIAHLMPLDAVQSSANLVDLLRAAMQNAHLELQAISAENPELSGIGTTCMALLRSDNKLALAHIGDSRTYVLHEGRLTQVTRDHSFVQFLVDQGKISQDEAEYHPKRNVIMRTLGDSMEDLEIDVSVRNACPGDRWLLCSDGLSGVVSRETIEQTLLTVEDPGQAADLLIDLTLRAGAPDNVTVVVCDILSADSLGSGKTLNSTPQVVGSVSNEKTFLDNQFPAARAAALRHQYQNRTSTDKENTEPENNSDPNPEINLLTSGSATDQGNSENPTGSTNPSGLANSNSFNESKQHNSPNHGQILASASKVADHDLPENTHESAELRNLKNSYSATNTNNLIGESNSAAEIKTKVELTGESLGKTQESKQAVPNMDAPNSAKTSTISRKITAENHLSGLKKKHNRNLDFDDDDYDDEKNLLPKLIALVATLAVIVGLGSVGYWWTQQQYYVGVKDDKVAIFQGVPWNLGSLKLSHSVEEIGVHVEDLTVAQRDAVKAGVPQNSLPEARQYVAEKLLVSAQFGIPGQPGKTGQPGQSGQKNSNSGKNNGNNQNPSPNPATSSKLITIQPGGGH